MIIYWLLILLSIAIGVPICGLKETMSLKRTVIYCIFLCSTFIVLYGLRLSVGIDYNSYAGVFYELNFMDYANLGDIRLEKGVLFPAKIVELFTYDYIPCFILLGFIMYIPIMAYAAKYSDNPWIGVFAFLSFGVFFNSLNFMRQIISAIFCAYGFKYAEKKSLFRFLIMIMLGTAFHRSALILLPCFILPFLTMNIFSLILALLTTISAFLLSHDLMKIATDYLFFYRGYSPDVNSREALFGLKPMYAIMFGTIFVIAFLLKNKIKATSEERNMLLWSSYAAFFFELIGTKHAIVSRLAIPFFFPVVFLLIPKLFTVICESAEKLLEKKNPKVGSAMAAAVLIAVMSINYGELLNRNYNGVVPYRTIWERDEKYNPDNF